MTSAYSRPGDEPPPRHSAGDPLSLARRVEGGGGEGRGLVVEFFNEDVVLSEGKGREE